MGSVYYDEYVTRDQSISVYNDDGTSQYFTHRETDSYSEYVPVDFHVELAKSKTSDDKQLVSGWASVSVNADGSLPLDWEDDTIPPSVLEKAAMDFMMDYRDSGVAHDGGSVGTVVESMVFTKEKQEAIGIPEGTVPEGWFITVKINDKDVYAKVKDGTYKMFSIQGLCKRVEL